MTSYRTGVKPNRRAAGRFVAKVHRTLQKAYEASKVEGVTQTSIAKELGVHRSVINRQLNGREDMSLGRVAEFAWALGCEIDFAFKKHQVRPDSNHVPTCAPAGKMTSSAISSGGGEVYKLAPTAPTSGNAVSVATMVAEDA